MNANRNQFKAGLFVIGGMVLSLLVIFLLTDFSRWTQKQQELRVSFLLTDGLRGLKPGSMVSLGDQNIGHVRSIEDRVHEGRVLGKVAIINIPAHYRIARDAAVDVVVPTFGTGTKLNFTSVGTGEPYQEGDYIPAGLAPNPLAAQLIQELGIGKDQTAQLKEVIVNLRDTSKELSQSLPVLSQKLADIASRIEPMVEKTAPAVENINAVSDNVRQITEQFRQRTPVWSQRVDTITQNVSSVTGMLTEKDPQIRGTIDNVHAITQSVREKTLVEVDTAVARASAALENLRKSTMDVRGLITGQRPILERAIANAELTTDQLKLAAVEVRRSPWRLLYKPGEKELETDNLYDAARSFALAAGSLDSAATALQAVSKDHENPEHLRRLLDHLDARFESFEQAEKAFWHALKNRRPGPGSTK
jgi:ABC-type transporter Mla subunit MlaD